MSINPYKIYKDRKEYALYVKMEKEELARHKRMMELISIASKNGMKN